MMTNLFERIVNFTGDGIYRYDFDQGCLLFCNPGFIRLLELDMTPEQAVGKRLDEILVYTERAGTVRQALEQDGEIHGYEYHFKTLTGHDRWVLHDSFIVEDEGRRVVEAIVKDQTAAVIAREELLAEKERLAVTLRSIGDGVIATDTGGRVQLMNKVAEALTGWTQGEALGRPLGEVFNIINEFTRKPCDNPVARVLEAGVVIGLANHTLLIARDGVERAIADSGAPIRDSKSRVSGAVLVFRDVTQEKRLAEEAIRAQKLESVGVLAGGIAHDFNNILTSILGNISLTRIITEAGETARAVELLNTAEKACLRARDLTGQLLTFAKGGAPVKRLTDLGQVIRESAEFVLRGSHCRAEFEMAPGLLGAEVDAGQISQVIQNLALNAAEAMPMGGVIRIGARNLESAGGIQTAPLPAGRYVELWVSDSGMGIPPRHLSRIFDPYFTTKKKGSGLGLTTVHSIVERHNGHVYVESRPGEGSVFRVFLPASGTVPSRPNAAEPSAAIHGSGRVLLMDDDPNILELARAMLQTLGYEISVVPDGAKALEAVTVACRDGRPFDYAVLDLTVPGGMGGCEAMQRIKLVAPGIKALVSSGYSSDPVMGDYAAYGFSGVIAKPYSISQFSLALHDLAKAKAPGQV